MAVSGHRVAKRDLVLNAKIVIAQHKKYAVLASDFSQHGRQATGGIFGLSTMSPVIATRSLAVFVYERHDPFEELASDSTGEM